MTLRKPFEAAQHLVGIWDQQRREGGWLVRGKHTAASHQAMVPGTSCTQATMEAARDRPTCASILPHTYVHTLSHTCPHLPRPDTQVEEINASISERKVRLAPQIKKLRLVRQEFATLEAEHTGSKQQYDAAMSQYESRVSSLETEVNVLKAELMENESKFHLLYCQLNVADQNIKRVRPW